MDERIRGLTGDADFAAVLSSRHGLVDLERIGKGGMAVVYRAWDPQLQRHVAVKRLFSEMFDGDYARRRFRGEMVILAKIRHSAVVQIHHANFFSARSGETFALPLNLQSDIGYTSYGPDSDAYFVMDYVEGTDLSKVIRYRREKGHPFSIDEVVKYLGPIAKALDHIHFRLSPSIIHRDVKPENILVPSDPTAETSALLADFGISLSPDETRLTSLSYMVGTERYLAPELLQAGFDGAMGRGPGAPATEDGDNYALSLIAFEMLTLRPLRDLANTGQWRTDRPMPDLHKFGTGFSEQEAVTINGVFRKALAAQPSDRYRTASQFIEELAVSVPRDHPSRTSGEVNPDAVTVQNGRGGNASKPVVVKRSKKTGGGRKRSGNSGMNKAQKSPNYLMRRTLTALILVLLVAVSLITFRGNGESLNAELVAEFPELLPTRSGGSGWGGSICGATDAGLGAAEAVLCEGEGFQLTFLSYEDVSARDAAFVEWEREQLLSPSCRMDSIQIPAEGGFYLLPVSVSTHTALMLAGPRSAELYRSVPVC